MKITIDGLEELVKELEKMAANVPEVVKAGVQEAAITVERYAKDNVKCGRTGELRRSIESEVIDEGGVITGKVGSNLEYAPYVEYGTGLFAEKGDGRKQVPWSYQDDLGDWYSTYGQHPKPFLTPAFNKDEVREIIADVIREVLL